MGHLLTKCMGMRLLLCKCERECIYLRKVVVIFALMASYNLFFNLSHDDHMILSYLKPRNEQK